MKIRKTLWGLNIRETDRRLKRLQEEIHSLRHLIDRQLRTELEQRDEELEKERQLLEELRRRENSQRSDVAPETRLSPKRARIGELLLSRGFITEEQLNAVIEHQQRYGGRLGDLLVDLGYISYEQLAEVLQTQTPKQWLGQMLLEQGHITQEQLDQALEFQRKSGGLLGDILMSLRFIEPEKLYRALATQTGIGRIGHVVQLDSLPKLPVDLAREMNAVVIAERSNRYLVAVGTPLSDAQVRKIEDCLSRPIEQVLATRQEMEKFWKKAYHEELMDISIKSIITEQPDNSAHVTFTRTQLLVFGLLFFGLLSGLAWNWLATLIVLNCLIQPFYFGMTLFKFYIILKGAQKSAQIRISPEELDKLDERELPVYTILVPMYKESKVIPTLMKNIERLDYPKAKLDVRLLIEEDDTEALEVLHSMNLPPYYSIIVVPDSYPKTKPKACNYGLIHARGEYVVIFDAEDRPDPDQLKKVHLAFSKMPENVVCIQAKLNYFNSEQNLLTRWFTTEYSVWFELLLPGVMQLDIPIPLGGTSNHFKMKALKLINAWDPFNVTEDADLGIRLYKKGYKTGIIDSRTWEEANSRVGNWIRQRSRWIKGYMQTWLVHMRNPVRLWKELGRNGFIGFQVMVLATPVLPLLNPLFWIMLGLWFGWKAGFVPLFFPGPIYYMASVGLLVGNFFFVFNNAAGMYWIINEMHKKNDQTFSYGLVKYALSTPIYWGLMSVAAVKALWQLITKPSYWEKTEHGFAEEYAGSTGKEAAM